GGTGSHRPMTATRSPDGLLSSTRDQPPMKSGVSVIWLLALTGRDTRLRRVQSKSEKTLRSLSAQSSLCVISSSGPTQSKTNYLINTAYPGVFGRSQRFESLTRAIQHDQK